MKRGFLVAGILPFVILGSFLPRWCLADEGHGCVKSLAKDQLKGILAKVEIRYSEITDLKADFLQESFFLGLGERKSSAGVLAFSKPGKMNWEYKEPEPQHFISDGHTLWFYQPDLNQVTVSDFSQSFHSDLPVSFLLGLGKLQEDFTVSEGCDLGERLSLSLSPKNPDKEIQEFYLVVDSKDFTPKGATIQDPGGNETTIRLQKVSVNSGTRNEDFKFVIPKGVDVINANNTGASKRKKEAS